MESVYYSPSVEVLELVQEGVLCGSNESLEDDWGEWDFVKGINQ